MYGDLTVKPLEYMPVGGGGCSQSSVLLLVALGVAFVMLSTSVPGRSMPGCYLPQVGHHMRARLATTSTPSTLGENEERHGPLDYADTKASQDKSENLLTLQTTLEGARETGTPLIVMVHAPWCGHCKVAKPLVQKHAKQNPDVKYAYVNGDAVDLEACGALLQMSIEGFPTVLLITQDVVKVVDPQNLPNDLGKDAASVNAKVATLWDEPEAESPADPFADF